MDINPGLIDDFEDKDLTVVEIATGKPYILPNPKDKDHPYTLKELLEMEELCTSGGSLFVTMERAEAAVNKNAEEQIERAKHPENFVGIYSARDSKTLEAMRAKTEKDFTDHKTGCASCQSGVDNIKKKRAKMKEMKKNRLKNGNNQGK